MNNPSTKEAAKIDEENRWIIYLESNGGEIIIEPLSAAINFNFDSIWTILSKFKFWKKSTNSYGTEFRSPAGSHCIDIYILKYLFLLFINRKNFLF
jgi:hypothetical protein